MIISRQYIIADRSRLFDETTELSLLTLSVRLISILRDSVSFLQNK